jgi:benzoyl-CoA reductase/2-hydroxyglutaryl-CoA dehydratase subunit BcrC/BadD/HgdB
MQQLLEEFRVISAERPYELLEEHAKGAKICEYTGRYVPEEIIYAAGAKAYPMWRGGEPEPPDAVLDESVRFLNPYARTQYGLIKLGLDPIASEANLYACSLTDCHTYRICELIERTGVPLCKVGVPTVWQDDDDLEYYARKIKDLVVRLEKATGNKITDESLSEGIAKYNQIRALLRQINEFRKKPVPPLQGSDFVVLGHCAMMCDPDVAIKYLEKALEICKTSNPQSEIKPRIAIFGHVIAYGDYFVLKAIENAGACIVGEILDDGRFEYLKDVSTEGSPLDAIIRNRFRDVLPNNNMQPSWDLRRQTLRNLVEEFAADGVVWYDTLYSEIYDMEYSCMAEFLTQNNIPLTRISTSYEYTREAMGPLNTRVETYVETLQRR